MKTTPSVAKVLSVVLLILGAVSLVTCGGGGGDGGGGEGASPEQTEGIWTGTASLDSQSWPDVVALIDSTGRTNIILQRTGGGDDQFRGNLVSSQGTLDSSESFLSLFGFSGDLSDVFSLTQGYVSPGSALTATLSTAGSFPRTATLNLTYDTVYDRPASLALVSGTWGETIGTTYTLTLAIDSAGTINGSDSQGCVYSGTVRIPDRDHDLYTLNVDIQSCYNIVVHATGQGVLTPTLQKVQPGEIVFRLLP
jgi:hypothetical protein